MAARLIYSAITSLDGYVADADGNFAWSAPDEEVHAFVNDLERPIGTYLYGRRMYDVMQFWQTVPTDDSHPAVFRDFAQLWQAADKVVYSATLDTPVTPRTRVERSFEPEAIKQMKQAADRDISVGGAHLAAQALRTGLVDELQLFLSPVVIGAGTHSLPAGVRIGLDLQDERRFGNGVVHLRYRVTD
jgi:dihydrofolate reductase